ncbi:MAG: hypothetical protein HRU33_20975 [Rhodobacteraceae bacterium]|nr:hypothetical protein [Paracoccaceae bacterium]
MRSKPDMIDQRASGRAAWLGRTRMPSEKILRRFDPFAFAKIPNLPKPLRREYAVPLRPRHQLNAVARTILKGFPAYKVQKFADCKWFFNVFHESDNTHFEYDVSTHFVQCEE